MKTKKRNWPLMLFFLCVALGILLVTAKPVMAAENDTVTEGGINYVITQTPGNEGNGKVKVGDNIANIALAKPGADVVIPETITLGGENAGTYDVTAIADDAFNSNSGYSRLKTVTIPKTVTSIGNKAFLNCRNLKSIGPLAGVKSIGNEAFRYCTTLELTETLGSLESIGDAAFEACKLLESINLGEKLTTIGSEAFRSSGLKAVTIPKSVKNFGKQVFLYCSNLTSVKLTEGLTVIGEEAFRESALKAVTIPKSITNFGKGTFILCDSLKSVVLADGLTTIGIQAFHMSGLTSVKIPSSVTTFGEGAFSGCKSLASVELADGLKIIGETAFFGTGIKSVIIPKTVETFGPYAFSTCKSLASVTLAEGLKTIGSEAFSESGLTFVEIPASVTDFGGYAFAGCSSLTSAKLADGLKTLGLGAFFECGIKSVVIPGSVETFGLGAFYQCASLTSIVLSEGLHSIGDQAFNGCAVQSVFIPESIQSIGEQAFINCGKLTELVFAGATPPAFDSEVFTGVPNMNTSTLYCSEEALAGYKADAYLASALSNWNFVGIAAETPAITAHPQNGSYTTEQSALPLTVSAAVSDNGTLSYQWYSNQANGSAGGAPVQGAVSESFTPPTGTVGTIYYYCVVTNTKDTVIGQQTAQAASSAASITVTPPSHKLVSGPEAGKPLDLTKDAVFVFEGRYENVIVVRLNGNTLKLSPVSGTQAGLSGYPGYTPELGNVKAGSVIVTLYKEFLSTLPSGAYKLEVMFTDGGAETAGEAEFTLQEKAKPTNVSDVPVTGDKSNVWPWVLLILAALGSSALVIVRKHSYKKNQK